MGVMLVGSVGCWLGPITVICADAALPFPASVEVTALVTLFCAPAVVPKTFTAKEQEAAADRLAPDRLTPIEPAAAVIVPPPHVPVNPLGVDTIRPDGRVSGKAIPLSEAALGFDRLKVRVVLPFNATLAAPNAFEIVGGNFAGGGGEPLDDPPPHPPVQKQLTAVTHMSDNEPDPSLHLRVTGAALLNMIWYIIRSWRWPTVHLPIELFHLVFRLLDLLRQNHFLLCHVIHLKTSICRAQLIMGGGVKRVRLHRHTQIFDGLLPLFLGSQHLRQAHLSLNLIGIELVGSLVVRECLIELGL